MLTVRLTALASAGWFPLIVPKVLHTRNVLEWMNDFERKFQLRTLSEQLLCFAIAKNVLVEHIIEYAESEVDGSPSCRTRFQLMQSRV
jgi:hypothetical protein